MTKNICRNCAEWGSKSCAGANPNDKNSPCFVPRDKNEDEERNRPVERLCGVTDEGVFEAVMHDGKPAFMVLHDGSFSITESITVGDEVYVAKPRNKYPYQPYEYIAEPVTNREELFWRIREEFRLFVDVEPTWLDVLASCVMLSYQQEKLQTVPYLFIYGDNESGKSTVLQILNALCYRPMYGVSIPSADLYGYLEDAEESACILEDEIQGVDKDIEKVKIYKSGYKRGACVPRTVLLQHDREIRFYNTFCFKACVSERIPEVKGFRERFIEIPMVEGYPPKEWCDITREDSLRVYSLRNLLLKWRMLSRGWELPAPEVTMTGRLKELWKPLLQVTSDLTVYATLANFIDNQRQARLNIKQSTLEGHIVKIVTQLYKGKLLPFTEIWDALASDLEAPVEGNTMHTSEFWKVSKKRIGCRLREVLSGEMRIRRDKVGEEWVSTKGYIFNSEKLSRVARKYGYQLVTEVTDVTNSKKVGEPEIVVQTIGENGSINEKCNRDSLVYPSTIGYNGNELHQSVTRQDVPLTRIAPAEPCELCGEHPVEFQFLNNGHPVRRCPACIERMRAHYEFIVLEDGKS